MIWFLWSEILKGPARWKLGRATTTWRVEGLCCAIIFNGLHLINNVDVVPERSEGDELTISLAFQLSAGRRQKWQRRHWKGISPVIALAMPVPSRFVLLYYESTTFLNRLWRERIYWLKTIQWNANTFAGYTFPSRKQHWFFVLKHTLFLSFFSGPLNLTIKSFPICSISYSKGRIKKERRLCMYVKLIIDPLKCTFEGAIMPAQRGEFCDQNLCGQYFLQSIQH